jgi:hypothetical protein
MASTSQVDVAQKLVVTARPFDAPRKTSDTDSRKLRLMIFWLPPPWRWLQA